MKTTNNTTQFNHNLKPARFALLAALTLVTFISAAVPAAAQDEAARATTSVTSSVPRLVRFAGVAKDTDNKSMTGTLGITFLLYKDQQGGAPLWMETQNVQADASGRYSAQLGATKPEGLPTDMFTSGEARWLAVQISGQAEQARVLLLSVPYALKAGDAATIGGLPPSAFLQAAPGASSTRAAAPNGGIPQSQRPAVTGTGTTDYIPLWLSSTKLGSSELYQSKTGDIGVETTSPAATLDVNGTVNAATSYQLGGIAFAYGSYASFNAFLGFAGNATMTGSANTASGYKAFTNNTTGYGNTASGHEALVNNTSGFDNTATGQFALGNNVGVLNTASGLNALLFNTTGGFNTGVGVNSGSTADESGVTGSNDTALGANTFLSTGSLTNATAIGANAEVTESNALVLGSIEGVNNCTPANGCASVNVGIGTTAPNARLDVQATNLQALIGDPGCGANFAGIGFVVSGGFTNCTNYAVLGDNLGVTYINSSQNGSIRFRNNNGPNLMTIDTHGNVDILGNLSKGSGSFKIDHPLDPANKYLYHSFVESPDMMNVYNGNIVTNKRGIATVVLPDYFEALNREFRYQLTPIGQFAQAVVAKEISRNRFTIKTSKPGVKVSWQVTGVRHDAYADANRIQVEVEKPLQEQGHYLHPELFGASRDQQVGYIAPASTEPAGHASRSFAMRGNR